MNWELISCIFSALHGFEEQHKWSLSIGENEKLAKAFYDHFSEHGFPSNQAEVHKAFEKAYIATWGHDHECDATKPEEMQTLLFALSDLWYSLTIKKPWGGDFLIYMDKLGLSPAAIELTKIASVKAAWAKEVEQGAEKWAARSVKESPEFDGERTAGQMAFRDGAEFTLMKMRRTLDSGKLSPEFEKVFRENFWNLLA